MNATLLAITSAVAALAVSVLSGCASTERLPTATYSEPIATDQGIVYVFRASSMPTRANVRIEVDGATVAWLPDNSFTWVAVAPGRRNVRVGYQSFPDMSKTVDVDIEPGVKHLLHYEGSRGGGNYVPLYGSRGAYMGTMFIGDQPWTKLTLAPAGQLQNVARELSYVPARP